MREELITNRSMKQFNLDPLNRSSTTSVCYSGEAPNTLWPFLYQPYVVPVAYERSIEAECCSKLAEVFRNRLPLVVEPSLDHEALE